MLYEFKQGHHATEATKNICYGKGKGGVDQSTITRWFKKFGSGCKSFDSQTRSGRPKTMDFEAVLKL